MMKCYSLFFALVSFACHTAIGQVTFNYYTNRFTPIEEPDDVASSGIKTTMDGGYVAFSNTSTLSIIKFDSAGGLTWSYDFNSGKGRAGIQLKDGGYAAVGSNGNILAVRTDANGNQLWAKTYSAGINGNWVQQTLDGGLIIGGYGQSSSPFDDAVLIKTDINGNVQWSKEYALNGNHVENLSGVQLSDSTYVFGGGIGYVSPNGIVLVKTDKNGNMLWDKAYEFAGQSYSFSMRETRDDGFIMVGTDNNPVWHVIKSDSAGNIQWSKRIYPNISNPYGYCMDVEQLDYGYALAGWYYNSVGYCSSYLVKIDPTGNLLWDGTYHDQFWTGLFSVKQTPDKGLVAYGYAQNSYQWGDFVKTDSNGQGACFVPIDMVDTNFTFTTTGAGLAVSSPANTATNVTGPWSGGVATATFICANVTLAAQFNASNTSICSGDTVAFADKSTGSPTSWSWTFTGGAPDTSTAQNPRVVYTMPGTYSVKLVVSNSGGADSLTQTSYITVNPLPVPGTITGPGPVCAGDSAQLSDTGSTGSIQWQSSLNGAFFSDIPGDTSSINDITSLTQTTYYRIIAGGCGTDSSASFELVVNPLPVPVVTTMDSLICSGDSTLVCTTNTFSSYSWNTSDTSQCTTIKAAGGYWVTVTDANHCSAISGHQEISVYPVPSVSIIVQGDTLSSYGQASYQWILNGNPVNGATSPVFIATSGGSYTVQVTDTNGCTATSNAVAITGIMDLAEEGVSVYPNPNSVGSWQLTVSNGILGSALDIYDDNGRLVFQSTIRNPQSEINLNVPAGIYLLRISGDSLSLARKLIKL